MSGRIARDTLHAIGLLAIVSVFAIIASQNPLHVDVAIAVLVGSAFAAVWRTP